MSLKGVDLRQSIPCNGKVVSSILINSSRVFDKTELPCIRG
jgi:hypothetical protein